MFDFNAVDAEGRSTLQVSRRRHTQILTAVPTLRDQRDDTCRWSGPGQPPARGESAGPKRKCIGRECARDGLAASSRNGVRGPDARRRPRAQVLVGRGALDDAKVVIEAGAVVDQLDRTGAPPHCLPQPPTHTHSTHARPACPTHCLPSLPNPAQPGPRPNPTQPTACPKPETVHLSFADTVFLLCFGLQTGRCVSVWTARTHTHPRSSNAPQLPRVVCAGRTGLHIAAAEGDAATIRLWLALDAQIDLPTMQVRTQIGEPCTGLAVRAADTEGLWGPKSGRTGDRPCRCSSPQLPRSLRRVRFDPQLQSLHRFCSWRGSYSCRIDVENPRESATAARRCTRRTATPPRSDTGFVACRRAEGRAVRADARGPVHLPGRVGADARRRRRLAQLRGCDRPNKPSARLSLC